MNPGCKLVFLIFTMLALNKGVCQSHHLYITAEQAYKDKDYDNCRSMLSDILSKPSLHHDSTLASTYKLMGDLHLKKYELKSSIRQYDLSDKLYEKLGRQHAMKRLNVVNKIGICYAQQDNLIMTSKYFKKAYDIAIEIYPADDLNVGKATNNLATVYLYIGDYDESLKYFYKSEEIKKKFADDNPISLGKTYENISTIFGQINQMSEAETYLQKAGQLYQKDNEANKPTLLGYYLNMAGFYLENERVNDALLQLEKGEALSEDYKGDKLEVLILHKLLGEAYLQKKDNATALKYFTETEKLVQQFDVGENEMGDVYTEIAAIFADDGKRAKSMHSLAEARSSILKNYDKSHKNYLGVLQKQIHILLKMRELKAAEALIAEYKTNFESRNEILSNDLLFSNLKMGLYTANLNYSLVTYTEHPAEQKLEEAIRVADEVIDFQDQVLETISDKESKLFFFSYAYTNFSAAIYLLLEKYKSSSDKKYQEQAFLLAEKTKYYSFREARGLRHPELEKDVPIALIEEEKAANIQLNQTISKYENQLEVDSDPDQMLSLINQIDSLKKVHNGMVDKLAAASPTLTKYLRSESPFDLVKVQEELKGKNQIYISYFLNSNELLSENYAFVMDKNGLRNVLLPCTKDSLSYKVNNFMESIKLDMSSPNTESQLQAYKGPASNLYASLISPLSLKDNDGLVFNLHEKLHSVPFEALWNDKKQEFLIQEYPMSYSYSVNSILNSGNIEYDEGYLLCSPRFEAQGVLGLLPLENNKDEVSQIARLIGANDAIEIDSKADFKKNVSEHKFNVVHLATHASANQKKGYQSYLAFGNSKDDLLYSREIYGLPIYANLVVLSACESGDGELIESQGLLGLASAFAATATQSMVASLWKVNDASTSKIMTRYYQRLKKGDTKDKALQNAKLNYLKSVPKSRQHPFYWAGFIQMGSIETLSFESGLLSFVRSNLIWIFFGALAVAFGVYARKNKATPK